MEESRSFIDFYNKYKLIPVEQNIKSSREHFSKRDFLYSSIGLSYLAINNSSILEYGPGTGQNALNWEYYKPRKLTLIDGADAAIKSLQKLFTDKQNIFDEGVKIIKSDFLSYEPTEKFDIIWAEGCVPHQSDPNKIVNSMLKNLTRDGMFICSTISGIAHLSETIRRLTASIKVKKQHPDYEDLNMLIEMFKPDLTSLGGSTRFVKDWVIDVIIQPLHKTRLCSLIDVAEIGFPEYLPHHTYPKLNDKVCWYKAYNPEKYLDDWKEQYYINCMHLISSRAPSMQNELSDGINAEMLGDLSWSIAAGVQDGTNTLKEFTSILRELDSLYAKYPKMYQMPNLSEIAEWMENGCSNKNIGEKMAKYWGKCTQFISLRRIHNY